jgi:hypothetical protein
VTGHALRQKDTIRSDAFWLKAAPAVAVVGLLGAAIGMFVSAERTLFAYLAAYAFAWTLAMGMLFFVMLHHVTDSGWSTVVRRPAEQFLAAIPALAVLFIPILGGAGVLYEWARPEALQGDHLFEVKRPFLNLPFFIVRLLVYFSVWILLARIMRGYSLKQDENGDPQLSLARRRWSGPGLILYAFTLTFAAVDWLMTLDYAWFSTMFGVYVFAHGALASLALLSLIAWALRSGPWRDKITDDRIHDLGKLVFVFSVFWGYIAFSQWFLIWYANIPEETGWMIQRWEGGWRILTVVLVAGTFGVPFVVLLPAATKKRKDTLCGACFVVLAAHYLGMYWLVMPAMTGGPVSGGLIWIDACTLLFVMGVCATVVGRAMARQAIYPLRDPRLHEALAFDVHPVGEEAGAT